MKTISISKVCSEIEGTATWGLIIYGMRQIYVANDSESRRYWVFPNGGEVKNETKVKAGDSLGSSSNYPQMIVIGAPNIIFPNSVEYNSGDLCRIECKLFGENGKYYIMRICTVVILQDGACFGQKLVLTSETVEENIYHADQNIVWGKKVANITSRYGYREKEIPDVKDNVTLPMWLDRMRKSGRIKFYNPFDLLSWLHEDMDRLTDVLEKRILMKGNLDGNNL